MTVNRFRILYREFLFSIVDRELLSTHATGDSSQLVLQLVALLVSLSVCFCLPVTSMGHANETAFGRLSFAWTIEHFLIATTMLIVAIFAVLSWNGLLPRQRDVLVLGPLPVGAQTILLAKFGAVATALVLTVFAFNAVTGAIWPLALNASWQRPLLHSPRYVYDAALPPVSAADLKTVLDVDLAEAIRSGRLAPGHGGAVSIGIYQRGVRRIFTYGAAAPDSIFQIGSATKPFTGALLADMVERGIVRLDTPVRELMPSAGFLRPVGTEISLLDLATHHSGLPGIPANFHPADRANPVADFDVARLYAFLRTRGIAKEPDAAFRYSNLGFGLLAHALSRRAGTDYETLLRQVITGPLGMRDTVVDLSREQQQRFVQGYDDYRRPIAQWDFDVLAGAGGLKSTAPDMLAWLEANLHAESNRAGTLSDALASSHRVHSSMDAHTRLALAWWFHPESGEFEHPGSLLAFTADAFFRPADEVAAVVLSNVGPGGALSAEAVGEHIRARLTGKPAVSLADVAVPASGSVLSWIRLLMAYWLTMVAAATFVLGVVMGTQGLAATVLPRRHFLRVSPWLQLGLLCLAVGIYFLQPMVVKSDVLLSAQAGSPLTSSPSLWFLGLFQQVSGSPALAPLAHRAWIGLTVAGFGTALAFVLSCVGTVRHLAEQPDVAITARRTPWRPAFGGSLQRAVVQFSIRTILRSAQHRLILAFYWGLAFALVIVFVKSPRGQQLGEVSAAGDWAETAVPLLLSSVVMMAFAVLAGRFAFAMPRDLDANWIFRVVPVHETRNYTTARRVTLGIVSVAPVCVAWAATMLWLWPWQQALGHLVALALVGAILVEIALNGPVKIPCTCSYLPGKSHVHLAVLVAAIVLLPLLLKAARIERDALREPIAYSVLLGVLAATYLAARWWTRLASSRQSQPTFDEEPVARAVTLELWDSRL